MKVQLVLTLIMGVVEMLTYAGVLTGWAMLHPVLVAEGYFSAGCGKNQTATSCQSQIEQLNLVFTISTSLAPVVSLFTGWWFDKRGGWVVRSAAISVITFGNLMAAVSDAATSSWLLFIAFPLINIGGYGLGIINLQLSNLYPTFSASAVSLLSGSFDSAVVVYLVMGKVYGSSSVSFTALFAFMTGLCVVFHINTFTLSPRFAAPDLPPPGYQYGYREWPCLNSGGGASTAEQHRNAASEKDGTDGDSGGGGLMRHLRKRHTWTHIAHFCVFHFSLTFFIGSFNNWIDSKLHHDEDDTSYDVTHYVTVFGVTQCLALAAAPLSGTVCDFFRRRFIATNGRRLASMKAAALTLMIGDVLIVIMFAVSLAPRAPPQYAAMTLQVLGRSFMYATSAAFITVGYPARHLGTLYALMEFIGGFVLLLQFPATLLVTRTLGNNYDLLYGILMLACGLAIAHPLYLLRYVAIKSRRSPANDDNAIPLPSIANPNYVDSEKS